MPKRLFSRLSPLFVAAIGLATAGFVTDPPSAAHPVFPLAPTDCKQFAFSGETNIKLSTGPILTFWASGPYAGGPTSDHRTDHGTISGQIYPNRHVELTITSTVYPDDPPLSLVGDVGDDGRARGNFYAKLNGTWETPSPLGCADSVPPPKVDVPPPPEKTTPGPDVSFSLSNPMVARITDRSGVASQCEYQDETTNQSFRLEANSTADVQLPYVPLLQIPEVSLNGGRPPTSSRHATVTCDNGTSTQATGDM